MLKYFMVSGIINGVMLNIIQVVEEVIESLIRELSFWDIIYLAMAISTIALAIIALMLIVKSK